MVTLDPALQAQVAQDLGVVHPGLADQQVGELVIRRDPTRPWALTPPLARRNVAQGIRLGLRLMVGPSLARAAMFLNRETVCARAELATGHGIGESSSRHRAVVERSELMHVGVGAGSTCSVPG